MIFKINNDAGLLTKVVKGGFWVFALSFLQKLLSLARVLILAKILSPADFGVFGIALLMIATLETFSQTGFYKALIQKKGNIEKYLDEVWTVLILRGVVLISLIFFCASFMADFFTTPGANKIIQIVALSILFKALENVAIVYFQKELEFKKQFIYQMSGVLADFIVSIASVIILKNVWALVLGLLAGNFARFICSYCIHSYRPHIRISFAKTRELFGFGKWIFSSSILIFLLTQGDDLIVGKLLGVSALGFYQMAYKISNLPATEISHLISSVAFPAYSKLQNDLLKFKDAYLKVLQITSFLSIPLSGLIFVLAPEFTNIFLGQKWMPMVCTIQILSIYGFLRTLGATTGVVFMAVGKPQIRTKLQCAQLVFLAIIIYPLTIRWGIAGTAWAVASYALIFNFFAVFRVLNIIKSGFRKPILFITLPLISTFSCMGVILVLKRNLFSSVGMLHFLFLVVCGIITYIFIFYCIDLMFNYGYRKLLKGQVRDFISG